MATAKAADKAERVDPFKTKKTSTKTSKVTTIKDAGSDIKKAVDAWVAAKAAETKAKADVGTQDPVIRAYAIQQFANRQMDGIEGNFNIEGDDSKCQFQVQAKSKARSEEDVATFVEEYGQEAADALFRDDNSSIKINGKYLEANWSRLVGSLMEALTDDDFENLFTTRTVNVVEDVHARAKDFANDAKELAEIYTALELTTSLKK
jgi:hypothetical protein